MIQAINLDQVPTLDKEIKDAVLKMISAAFTGFPAKISAEEINFISNRDLGDEDAGDLFQS